MRTTELNIQSEEMEIFWREKMIHVDARKNQQLHDLKKRECGTRKIGRDNTVRT